MHSQASTQIAQALFDAFNAHDLDRLEALTSDGFLGIGPDSHDLRMGRRGGMAWGAPYLSGGSDPQGTKEGVFPPDAAVFPPLDYTRTPTRPLGRRVAVSP